MLGAGFLWITKKQTEFSTKDSRSKPLWMTLVARPRNLFFMFNINMMEKLETFHVSQ